MSPFVNNADSLKKRHPELYRLVCRKLPESGRFNIIASGEGGPTMKVLEDTGGFFLHSRYNPAAEGRSLAGENIAPDCKAYVLYGFGLGYHVEQILGMLCEGQILYVFDLNTAIFRMAVEVRDLSGIFRDSRLKLCITDNYMELLKLFARALEEENAKLIIHSPSLRAVPEKYGEFRFFLESWKIKTGSFRNRSQIARQNREINRTSISGGISSLFGRYAGIPIVVVSAGPSLDKNIGVLKKYEDRALIITVGRALKNLLNNGIKPDFFIITDPTNIVDMQLEGINDIGVKGIFLSTASHTCAASYKGPKYIAFTDEDEADGAERVETGGSVATAALDIAVRFGGNPVILVGQDLAYSEGRRHASHTGYEAQDTGAALENPGQMKTKGFFGDEAITSVPFMIFKRWIEQRIMRERNVTFINATEGGVFIEGAVHTSLEEAIGGLAPCREKMG